MFHFSESNFTALQVGKFSESLSADFQYSTVPPPDTAPSYSSATDLRPRVVVQRRVMAGQEKHLEECSVANAMGTWFFSVGGALLAIPVGIKRKSLAPLVFFGTTGTMLDIIMGISQCEREHAEQQAKLLEAQNAVSEVSFTEGGSES